MKVLVTGGSGFVGTALSKKLIENGHSVTALYNTSSINDSTIQGQKVDLTESSFDIKDDFDVVIHLAAATPLEKNKKTLKKINYQGTVNLFEKIKSKTKFFIYISGLGIFGDTNEKTIDETNALNPHTEYAKIRLDAQRFLEKECKENNIAFSVAYLGEVYGNGGWFTTQIIERLKKGSFKMPKSGEYYRSFVHVTDVANALTAIAEKNAVNESFIIVDSKPILFKEFINFTADKLEVKHPGSIPAFLAKTVLGGDFVKLLTTPTIASNEKISKICEFQYPTYKEGIEKTISEL